MAKTAANYAASLKAGEEAHEKSREFLILNFELVANTFNQVGYKNLRSFKQTIFDFERFWRY